MGDALKRKNKLLERENSRYRDLFKVLHTKPNKDALEILRRIRAEEEPLAVLDATRESRPLLPVVLVNATAENRRLSWFNQSALESSTIQVPALPWSTVAGLVSELVTNYLT